MKRKSSMKTSSKTVEIRLFFKWQEGVSCCNMQMNAPLHGNLFETNDHFAAWCIHVELSVYGNPDLIVRQFIARKPLCYILRNSCCLDAFA